MRISTSDRLRGVAAGFGVVVALAGAAACGGDESSDTDTTRRTVVLGEGDVREDEALASFFVAPTGFEYRELDAVQTETAFLDLLVGEQAGEQFDGYLGRAAVKLGETDADDEIAAIVVAIAVKSELADVPTFDQTFAAQYARELSSTVVGEVRVFEQSQPTEEGTNLRKLWTRDGIIYAVQGFEAVEPDLDALVAAIVSG